MKVFETSLAEKYHFEHRPRLCMQCSDTEFKAKLCHFSWLLAFVSQCQLWNNICINEAQLEIDSGSGAHKANSVRLRGNTDITSLYLYVANSCSLWCHSAHLTWMLKGCADRNGLGTTALHPQNSGHRPHGARRGWPAGPLVCSEQPGAEQAQNCGDDSGLKEEPSNTHYFRYVYTLYSILILIKGQFNVLCLMF